VSPTAISLLQGLPITIVLAILYLAFIRPQWRIARAHKRMLGALKPGDIVVTDGGLYARITKLIDDRNLVLEFGPSVQIKARKQAISEVVLQESADPLPEHSLTALNT